MARTAGKLVRVVGGVIILLSIESIHFEALKMASPEKKKMCMLTFVYPFDMKKKSPIPLYDDVRAYEIHIIHYMNSISYGMQSISYTTTSTLFHKLIKNIFRAESQHF